MSECDHKTIDTLFCPHCGIRVVRDPLVELASYVKGQASTHRTCRDAQIASSEKVNKRRLKSRYNPPAEPVAAYESMMEISIARIDKRITKWNSWEAAIVRAVEEAQTDE